MKTKTVVELTTMELTDALIATAKKSVQAGPGSMRVEVLDSHGQLVENATASVVFEWGAKAKNGE